MKRFGWFLGALVLCFVIWRLIMMGIFLSDTYLYEKPLINDVDILLFTIIIAFFVVITFYVFKEEVFFEPKESENKVFSLVSSMNYTQVLNATVEEITRRDNSNKVVKVIYVVFKNGLTERELHNLPAFGLWEKIPNECRYCVEPEGLMILWNERLKKWLVYEPKKETV